LLISVLGTSGFFTGIFSVWKILASAKASTQAAKEAREANASKAQLEKDLVELRMRIEPLELERLRAESEAKQAAAMNQNIQNLIEAIVVGNERWQRVIDVKSERQLEADRLQHESNKLFAEAMKNNADAMGNLTEMIEIQSEHYQAFKAKVDGMEGSLETTLKTVTGLAQDNRTDLTTALGLSVTSRNENETTLRTIKESIHGVVREITSIMEEDKRERAADLSSIKKKLQAIETALTPHPETATSGNDESDTLKSA
jgi:hypothetical protein